MLKVITRSGGGGGGGRGGGRTARRRGEGRGGEEKEECPDALPSNPNSNSNSIRSISSSSSSSSSSSMGEHPSLLAHQEDQRPDILFRGFLPVAGEDFVDEDAGFSLAPEEVAERLADRVLARQAQEDADR